MYKNIVFKKSLNNFQFFFTPWLGGENPPIFFVFSKLKINFF